MLSVINSVPREALNWRLALAAVTVGLLGAARGLDEGIISSQVAQPAFIKSYGIANGSAMQSNITSMGQLGAIPGSIIAWWTSDKFGRLNSCRITCLIWIVGTIVWMTSAGNVGQLIAGRFISGMGMGGTVVAGPTYLAEIAPKSLRGTIVSIFSGSVYLGILLGYCANLGVKLNLGTSDNGQFIIPTSLNLILATLVLIGSAFIPESPRWYMRQHKEQQAIESMCWLRQLRAQHPFVRGELDGMRDSIEEEQKSRGSDWKWYSSLKQMFTSKANLYILMLTCGTQVWGQFSGGGSITIYAPTLFTLVNNGATVNTSLYTTVIFGVVKLISALAAGLFLLDFLGRKRAAMLGISLQIIASVYIAVYLSVYPPTSGSAVPAPSAAEKRASIGAILMIFVSGIGWSGGFNNIQYLVSSEYFPINTRALGTMFAMAMHFICQFGSSRSVNPMLAALKPHGTFAFWAAEGFCCLFLVWFFLPEAAGRPLEEMQELFAKPWYRIGWTANTPVRGKLYNEFDPEEMNYSVEPQTHEVAARDQNEKDKSDATDVHHKDAHADHQMHDDRKQ